MKKKILLVGGKALRAHLDNGCFDEYRIVDKYFGLSPFSLGESERIKNVPKTRLTLRLRYDANNDFNGFLNKNKADYIFVDLQRIIADLLNIDNRFYTDQPNNKDAFYAENRDKLISPLQNDYNMFYRVFDSFANTVLKYFSDKNIVLLCSCVPQFYAVGRRVRKLPKPFKDNKWYLHFEKRFVDITKCSYYDKCKFYFCKKPLGANIDRYGLESEYYFEAKKDFAALLNGKSFCRLPDYSLCVERYARYCTTLNKHFLETFLSVEDTRDRFLMACPEKFAKENSDKFVALHNSEGKLGMLKLKLLSGDFLNTYKAFLNAESNPSVSGIDLDLIFKNKIMIPQLLKYIREKSSLQFPKQITYDNYGEVYHNNTIKEMPIPIDVVGTCISRFIFNFDESNFAVNNYAFHYMPVFTDIKEEYDKSKLNDAIWTDRMIKLQAECGLKDYLGKSPARWVVIDLFTLIELTAFLIGKKPIGSAGGYINKLKREKVVICDEYDENTIIEEIKKFADLLTDIYQDRIILVSSLRQFLKVDDTDKIMHYRNEEASSAKNEKCKRFEKAFCDYTGCRYININDQFLSSDCSVVSLSPAHYEDECYLEEAKIVLEIIKNNSDKKIFDKYTTATRLNRIIRFKKAGNGEEELGRIFKFWQDKIAVKLSCKQIEKNFKLLQKLYDSDNLDSELDKELKSCGISANSAD